MILYWNWTGRFEQYADSGIDIADEECVVPLDSFLVVEIRFHKQTSTSRTTVL